MSSLKTTSAAQAATKAWALSANHSRGTSGGGASDLLPSGKHEEAQINEDNKEGQRRITAATAKDNEVKAKNAKSKRLHHPKNARVEYNVREMSPDAVTKYLDEYHEANLEALHEQVETRLRERGLESVERGGEGNCFFHSVAYAINSLRSTNIDHRDVRAAVVAYARHHPTAQQYIAWHEEGTFVKNVNELARDNVWIKSDAEIITVAALYGVGVQLITHKGDLHFDLPDTNVQDQITLAYYDQYHYRGTRTIEEPRGRSNSLASQSTNGNDGEVRNVGWKEPGNDDFSGDFGTRATSNPTGAAVGSKKRKIGGENNGTPSNKKMYCGDCNKYFYPRNKKAHFGGRDHTGITQNMTKAQKKIVIDGRVSIRTKARYVDI